MAPTRVANAATAAPSPSTSRSWTWTAETRSPVQRKSRAAGSRSGHRPCRAEPGCQRGRVCSSAMRGRLRLGTLAFLIALSVSIGLLVQRGWPKTANGGLPQTLEGLRGPPVPVFVVVPQQPRDTTGTLEPDGYTYTIVRGDSLVVRGRRTGLPDEPPRLSAQGQVSWTKSGATYTITAESDLRDG